MQPQSKASCHHATESCSPRGKTGEVSMGIIEPMYINVWAHNVRRLSNKPQHDKVFRSTQVYRDACHTTHLPRKGTGQLYSHIVNDMIHYFSSMKMNSYKKKTPKQPKHSSVELIEDLNIRGIKRIGDPGRYNNVNGIKDNGKDDAKDDAKDERILHSINSIHQKNIVCDKRVNHCAKRQEGERVVMKRVSSKSVGGKRNAKMYNYYNFGRNKEYGLKDHNLVLQYTYYLEFVWKVALNAGFRYDLEHLGHDSKKKVQIYRYYVGKGNNSKLIRKVMSTRPWWVEQSKIQNAHFVWTQLKIYNIYDTQVKQPQRNIKILKQQANLFTKTHQNHILHSSKEVQIPNHQQRTQQLTTNTLISQDKNTFILNNKSILLYNKSLRVYSTRLSDLKRLFSKWSASITPLNITPIKITNHLQFSRVIGNKKALYKTMQTYFTHLPPFSPSDHTAISKEYMPLTYHITGGLQDQQYLRFLSQFYRRSKQCLNCWIVKPGEMSNRGTGIHFCRTLPQIKSIIKERKSHNNGTVKTYLIQQYLMRPLLYHKRKFDIRHYIMYVSSFGVLRGYFYQEGYIRTSSYVFGLDDCRATVHLTNDAIQKHCKLYGKYEDGNKVSYMEFDQYMRSNKIGSFYQDILPQIRSISKDILHAGGLFVDPHKRINNFQIFGIDIMVDESMKCYLIEVNTNPCLELSSAVLRNIIPDMLNNAFCIAIDGMVMPPWERSAHIKEEHMTLSNKFELVYESHSEESITMGREYDKERIQMPNYGDDDENYESCNEDQDMY